MSGRSMIDGLLEALSRLMTREDRVKRRSTIAAFIEPLAHLSVLIVALLSIPMLPCLFVIWIHHKLRTDADKQWNELMRSEHEREEQPVVGEQRFAVNRRQPRARDLAPAPRQ